MNPDYTPSAFRREKSVAQHKSVSGKTNDVFLGLKRFETRDVKFITIFVPDKRYRVVSSVGLEHLLDRQEVISSNLIPPT